MPWIGIKDATQNHGRKIHDTTEHTNDLGLRNSSARLLPKDTVCLSRTASVGYVVVMGRPMATSQDFANWVCGPLLDFRFLKYALLTERDVLLQFASGTTHQTIYYPELKAFHVCVPSLPEQQRIASLLSLLDDKIELNRVMAETLEKQARTIFKSWFVDFDPVHAKVQGKATGLPDDLAALFPDSVDDQGVPTGWAQSTVGNLFRVSGGNTPSTKDERYWGGDHAWVSPRDLSGVSIPVLMKTDRTLSDAGLGQSTSGLLPVGSLILSTRAPIGYMAITTFPVAINQGFAGLIQRAISPLYALFWCQENMAVIKSNASGSTFPEIAKSTLKALPMIEPSAPVMSAFEAVACPLFERLTTAVLENEVLAALRDTLLPKLISGELRIEHAHAAVAAA